METLCNFIVNNFWTILLIIGLFGTNRASYAIFMLALMATLGVDSMIILIVSILALILPPILSYEPKKK